MLTTGPEQRHSDAMAPTHRPSFVPIAHDPACPYCAGLKASPFQGIEAAYCISMYDQPHRAQRAAAQFHEMGLCRLLTFYHADRDIRAAQNHAIWRSHRDIACEALARGQSRILVFEDDIQFRIKAEKLAPRIHKAMAVLPNNWMGLFLGHVPLKAYPVAIGVLRTSSTCAHAYIANRPLLAWLAATPPTSAEVTTIPWLGSAIDSAFANLPQMYSISPMAVIQTKLDAPRIDTQLNEHGVKRHWLDIDRWRYMLQFRGAPWLEALAILLSGWHFLTLDRAIRRNAARTGERARAIRAAGLFDDAYYLSTYPDIAATKFDPLWHYVQHGAREGRWPRADFDPVAYAAAHPDLKQGENPLLHSLGLKGR